MKCVGAAITNVWQEGSHHIQESGLSQNFGSSTNSLEHRHSLDLAQLQLIEAVQIVVVDQLLLNHVGQGEQNIAEIKLHPPFVLIAFRTQIVVELPD